MIFKELKWECDGIETKEVGPIYSREVRPLNETLINYVVNFKNLRVNADSNKEQIVIKGNSFLATLHYYYYHSVIDMLGSYAFLKSRVPDLNCYFNSMFGKQPEWRGYFEDRSLNSYLRYLKYNPFGIPDTNPQINYHEYTEDLVNMFSKDKQIYTIETDNILFENFYVLMPIPTGFSGPSFDGIRDIKFLSEMILKFLKPSKNKNKIYISRKTNNKRYEEHAKHLPETKIDVDTRSFDEDGIEEYFKSIGYESVILEGMSFLDQLNMFYNATHIAGLSGSGFVNLLACQDNTRVIQLNLIENYSGANYEHFFKFKKLNFTQYTNFSGDLKDIISGLKSIENQ